MNALFLTLIFSLAVQTLAQAMVLIQYDGSITSTFGGSGIAFPGDSFSVSISIPSDLPDSDPSTAQGIYRALGVDPSTSATYTINNQIFQLHAENFGLLRTFNKQPGNDDRFEFVANLEEHGASGDYFNLFLIDSSGTVFTDDSIPNSLDIGNFDLLGSNLVIGDSGYFGEIQNFSYSIIPEPRSLTLLGQALLFALITISIRLTRRCSQPLSASLLGLRHPLSAVDHK